MRLALVLVLGSLILPQPVHSQQWNPQQQEVLQAVMDCWDLWMVAVEQGTPDPWLDSCETEDATFWAGADGAPNLTGGTFLRRNWGNEVGVDLAWVDLRPIYIGVRDDVAVLHFYGYWRLPGPVLEEWKRTEMWRREDGQWKLWVGHATPVER